MEKVKRKNDDEKKKKNRKFTRNHRVDYSIVGASYLNSKDPYSKLSTKATNRNPKLCQKYCSKQK